MSKNSIRIHNNLDLLDRMMKDAASAPYFYRPTNYWKFYEPQTLNYLKTKGLDNFRSYKTGTLASFGAGTSGKIPRASSISELQNLQYRYSMEMDKQGGLHILDSIEDSTLGNPYDYFRINEKSYTLSFLRYFDQMAYVKMHIDSGNLKSVMEIGSGYGGSAEVYVKTFPNIAYFNFDIPPQLYVAQQYLSSVFPKEVYTYEHFLSNEKMEPEKYRIFCLPAWALESISDINFDLLINSASFQEMEPDIVKNYYNVTGKMVNYIYLFELTYGTYKKTSERSGGCIEPLKIDDYIPIFKEFEVINRKNHYRMQNPCTHLILKK